MCRLLETIRIENGRIRNLEYHNRRFNTSRKELFGIREEADLKDLIRATGHPLPAGVFRCRVIYRREIERTEFIPHRERPVRSLKLVFADDIDYAYKYADRNRLEALFKERDDCDEILIVRGGLVTDTSTGNIVFRRTDGAWVTPDTPLLNGTMRMCLLEAGRIMESRVRPADLNSFTAARMINCMRDLESGPDIEMDRIVP